MPKKVEKIRKAIQRDSDVDKSTAYAIAYSQYKKGKKKK